MRDGATLGFVDGTVEGTYDEVGLNDGIDVKGIVGGKLGLDDMLECWGLHLDTPFRSKHLP